MSESRDRLNGEPSSTLRSVAGDEIVISLASAAEMESVFAMLVEAAEWTQSRGLRQWFPALFTEHLREAIEHQVAAGEVTIARISDRPVGTLTLQWSDEEVWGADDRLAGYVHRLAVRRAYAGRGIGRAMLEWAGRQCAIRDRPYLRLDAMESNSGLRAYYQSLGFTFQRVNPTLVWHPALYERSTRIVAPRA